MSTGLSSVTSSGGVEALSMTNPYTAIGFQMVKLMDGLGIFSGKTEKMEFSKADAMSINLTSYLISYETKQGNLIALNNLSNVFIDNVVNEMNDAGWGREKENILTDFQKLKTNNWTGISESQKYEVTLKRLFLWIFLNLDVNRQETFPQFSYGLYNKLIATPAHNAGIDSAYLLNDGKVQSSGTGTTAIDKVSNFIGSILGTNSTANDGTTAETGSNTIYYVIGIAVFLIIVFLIFRKG